MDRQQTGTPAHEASVDRRVEALMREYQRYMATEDADQEAFIERIEDLRDEAAGRTNRDEVELAALSEFLVRVRLAEE
jgi:hypothetical protein